MVIYFKILLFIAMCALPIFGARDMWLRLDFIWPAVIYSVLSLITFLIYRSINAVRSRASVASLKNPCNYLHCWAAGPVRYSHSNCFVTKPAKFRFSFYSGLSFRCISRSGATGFYPVVIIPH